MFKVTETFGKYVRAHDGTGDIFPTQTGKIEHHFERETEALKYMYHSVFLILDLCERIPPEFEFVSVTQDENGITIDYKDLELEKSLFNSYTIEKE